MKKIDLGKVTSSAGEFISNNKKPLLYIGGAIVVVVLGVAIVKKLKGGIIGDGVAGGKFNEQEVDEGKTTITDGQAKNYAENLFEAFNYTYGTDKSVIDGVFSRINPEDFKKVYNAYGKRSYSAITGGTPSPITYWFNTEKIDFLIQSAVNI